VQLDLSAAQQKDINFHSLYPFVVSYVIGHRDRRHFKTQLEEIDMFVKEIFSLEEAYRRYLLKQKAQILIKEEQRMRVSVADQTFDWTATEQWWRDQNGDELSIEMQEKLNRIVRYHNA